MKRINPLLYVTAIVMSSILLTSATTNDHVKKEGKRTLITAYCVTGNPTSDYINVHLWNGNHTYNFSVPPGAPSGYVLGSIEAECDYNVTLSSSGGPHTMQFYYCYAANTTYATFNPGSMCLTCGSCPTLRIS